MRILLSDTYIDPSAPRDNAWTAAYVNRLAAQEGLDLEARVQRSDLTRLGTLHNKGLVVDSERVLVSSINWSLNSPANNREAGLILDHPAIAQYYTDVFMSVTRDTRSEARDWPGPVRTHRAWPPACSCSPIRFAKDSLQSPTAATASGS